jgi:hypothetical protein
LNIKDKISCIYLDKEFIWFDKKFIWFDKNGGQIINASLNNITIIGNDEKGRKINVGLDKVVYLGCNPTKIDGTDVDSIGIFFAVVSSVLTIIYLYRLH